MNGSIRNVLGVAAVAALTMSATIAVFQSGQVGADDAEEPVKVEEIARITPEISTPTLEADGATIKLSLDKESYDDGDKPVVTVTVTNNSDKPLKHEISVAMTRTNFSAMSRMGPIPTVVWRHKEAVSVEPGKTETVELKTDTAIEASSEVGFVLGNADEYVNRWMPRRGQRQADIELPDEAVRQNVQARQN